MFNQPRRQRTMFLVASCVLLISGCGKWQSEHADAIIRSLDPEYSVGERTQHNDDLSQVLSLDLSNLKLRDDTTEAVARLKDLKWLDLDRSTIDDAGLAKLSAMENLESVSLDGTLVTVNGVRKLMKLPNLNEISVAGTLLSADDARSLLDGDRVHVRWSSQTRSNIELLQRACRGTRWRVLTYPDKDYRVDQYALTIDHDVAPSAEARKALVELTTNVDVALSFHKWTPSQWDFLPECGPRLYSIQVDRVIPGTIDVVLSAPHLTVVSLESYLDRFDVGPLAKLKHLRFLNLKGAAQVDTMLAGLGEELTELSVSYSDITGEGLAHLERHADLHELRLLGNKLTDDDLKALPVLPGLKRLNILNNRELTDAIDPVLQKQPALETVFAGGTALSEAVRKEFAPPPIEW